MESGSKHTQHLLTGANAEVVSLNGHRAISADRQEIERVKQQLRISEIARRELRTELAEAAVPDFGTFGTTLLAGLSAPPPVARWAVESLATTGSVVTLPSSRKTGKTTFLANLAACGVDGQPFLGSFGTFLDGTVAVVNAEMGRHDYLEPYRPLKIANANRIMLLNCRDDGIRLNLLDDVTADRLVAWLHMNDCRWLFLDPWKNFLAWAGVGLNDNDGVNLLATRVQEIHASAGVELTIIPMHTTQTPQEAGTERGKGAGELEDSADQLWRYVRSGAKRDDPRVLTVEGRGGAGLDETVVYFDRATGRLTLGEGDRQAVKADAISADILAYVAASPDCSGRKIEEAMTAKGHQQKPVREARGRLVAAGRLVTRPSGKDRATLHSVPDRA